MTRRIRRHQATDRLLTADERLALERGGPDALARVRRFFLIKPPLRRDRAPARVIREVRPDEINARELALKSDE